VIFQADPEIKVVDGAGYQGREQMLHRGMIGVLALAAALAMTAPARAFDDAQYPNLKGQWWRASGVQWDPTKPGARGQQAPLTAEYQAIYDARLKEQGAGGQDYNPQVRCLPPGMPRAMIAYEPFEIIVTPEITYMAMLYMSEFRRVYTDGRDWPEILEPTFAGYSIGRWIDTDGSGHYDALQIETRGMKGPRVVENTGIPLHDDNQTIVKEQLYLDKADPNLLHDDITTIDHALSRPWSVTRDYRREGKTNWLEYVCTENNNLVNIGGHSYFVRADGYLMPMEKNEPPPDLRYFKRSPE
jgi:hypothetical protein